MTIYSNTRDWLYDTGAKLRQSLEWWEPQDELTPLKPGYAYLKRPIPYEYRVYLKGHVSPDACKWLLANNNDKVKLGHTLIAYIEGPLQPRLNDFYFYAKSDRVLTVLQLLMGNNIRSVSKVVCLSKNA